MDPEWTELGALGRVVYAQRSVRRFPSVGIQGDTLFTWLSELAESVTQVGVEEGDQLRFNLLIRDPWGGGSSYQMTQKSFLDAWSGIAVFGG